MRKEWEPGRINSDLENTLFQTQAVRYGHNRSSEAEHTENICTSSSFVFSSAEEASKCFSGEIEANVYSRYTNPTVQIFENRMAALEGAEKAIATATGMAAIVSIIMGLCNKNDHILMSRNVFGTTINLCEEHLKRFGIDIDYVDLTDFMNKFA